MISLFGNALLVFAIATSILAICASLNRINRGTIYGDYLFLLSNVITVAAFLLLVFAFISSDFSVRNVFLNSSTIKPLIYKIAGSWASHEGSMLLYTALLGSVSSAYIKMANYQNITRNLQITILAFIQTLFLCFVYFTSNPFDGFKFTPGQGLGLNPVLQDEALSIHPPLLYLGYVACIAGYVNAILLLMRPEDISQILRNNIQFASFALMLLTTGIGLGAWWAYRELGWGGYWFFDPVENISLMPWLATISLIHFCFSLRYSKVQQGSAEIRMTIITSFLPFLLTLYGIFFVRSGIISSVHSFAFSKERGIWLVAICALLTIVAVIAYTCCCCKKQTVEVKQSARLWQGKIILGGNILWGTALLSLFVALVYPLYQSFFYGNEVAIDPEYFHKIFVPIFVPLMLLAGTVLYLGKNSGYFRSAVYISLVLVLLWTIIRLTDRLGVISGSIIFASGLLMMQMLDFLATQTRFFRQSISHKTASMIIGHFSLGLLAFSIAVNVVFSQEIEFVGKVGDSIKNQIFTVKLNDIKFSDGQNYYRQIAEFSLQDSSGNIVLLKPENRLYKIENSLSQEADIYSYLTHDMFGVLSKINGDTIHAIIYYRPMIFFIWLGVAGIAMSFFISLTCKSKTA